MSRPTDAGRLDWLQCRLLLGSKSPRRRELVELLGLPCRVVDIEADERLRDAVAPSRVAETIARTKSQAYTGKIDDDEVLVTADTVVVCQDRVLGKPHSHEEATGMLHLLSGCTHQVYTGVCLRGSRSVVSFTECTDVSFRPLLDEEVNYYVDTYRPYDKAGSYGIQEWIGMVGIDRIEGCFYNVMGLPVARLYKELKLLVDKDLARVDQ